MKNYGVLHEPKESDWLAGSIPFEERLPSGDWTPYLPSGELQYSNYADSMACVTFSALNVLETQTKFLNGESPDFSDRATAKLSGTTIHGNTLQNVWDSIRHDGVIMESLWPKPKNFTWDEFYAEIPPEVRDSAVHPQVQYEFIDATKDSMLHHIKQAPLHLVLPGHAVMGFFCDQDVEDYFDTYMPYQKSTSYGNISYVVKAVLTFKKNMSESEVRKQYALSFYRLPTAEELSYWAGKPLEVFLDTAIQDRAAFLSTQ